MSMTPQDMDAKSLSSRHVQQALQGILKGSSTVEASGTGLREVVTSLLSTQAQSASKGR